jgi:FtsP/CotA-like multicopper oxidase with cupredoxin domain
MDTSVRSAKTTNATPVARRPLGRAVRRRVSRREWTVIAAVALAALLPSSRLAAAAAAGQTCPTSTTSQPLTTVGEIKSQGGKLQAVIKVVSGERCISGQPNPVLMRYFAGHNPADPDTKWPGKANEGLAGPGPTLRAELGDVVQITFLNNVKAGDFGASLDSGEQGLGNGCDQATNASTTPVNKTWYPDTDKYPNCFHASSSANLHFHGMHVTPSTTGDNILITVRPNEKVTEQDVKAPFQQIFQHCELGRQPQKWGDLPQSWRDSQEKLLKQYDATAPYQGGHGLPPNLQLWPQDQKAIDLGMWPQFYSGSYAYCFQIPKCPVNAPCGSNLRMGEAPGTHWYHSHKHGSTALNLFNGLAGAFIITDNSPDGYDGKLKAFYKDKGKLEEKVLVFQQLSTVVNLLSAASPPVTAKPPGPPGLLVNGQAAPTITMQPGQVQLWRLINASVMKTVAGSFATSPGSTQSITFKQTAQDGVQLAWQNYNQQANGTQTIQLAPANRMDLLVQAPSTTGSYTLQGTTPGGTVVVYLNISVTGNAVTPQMGFPATQDDYPPLPEFLKDIAASTIQAQRNIVYGSYAPTDPAPAHTGLVQFTIDGKAFQDNHIDKVVELDTAEEWTIYNTDGLSTGKVAHPFHIHVNPFQVIEVYTPANSTPLQTFSHNYVWYDTYPIPAPVLSTKLPSGQTCQVALVNNYCPGYVKMRSRFVDFTGLFVQHCHILAHEDRGMMQLVEVVDNQTPLKHH